MRSSRACNTTHGHHGLGHDATKVRPLPSSNAAREHELGGPTTLLALAESLRVLEPIIRLPLPLTSTSIPCARSQRQQSQASWAAARRLAVLN